jgi:hypothetical protein
MAHPRQKYEGLRLRVLVMNHVDDKVDDVNLRLKKMVKVQRDVEKMLI